MTKSRIIIESGIIKEIEDAEFAELIVDGNKHSFPGCQILPGMTDSHCHVWGLGMMNSGLDISGETNAENTLLKAKMNNFRKGDWLIGRGWNNELWDIQNLPDKEIADKIFPDLPIAFTRVDGHSIWCNSKALEICSVNEFTESPAGGKIVCDDFGKPTGILIDNAMNLVLDKIPDYTDSQLENFILKGLEICLKSGITAVHDMDVSPKMVEIYHKLNSEGRLPIRVFAFVSCQNDQTFLSNIKPYQSEMFTIQGIKLFADGALGSYGAALLDDYSDKPGEKGILILDKEVIAQKSIKAANLGFDIAVHAIGDCANREVLDAFEIFRRERPNSKVLLRIEHSQIVDRSDISRFKEFNVVASVQPIHFVSDSEMAYKRLGRERLIDAGYPWMSFINNDVMLIGGSDFPIESHNPFLGLRAFVNRQNSLDCKAELDAECISLEDAIIAYTSAPYHSLGIFNNGILNIGNKADICIVKGDIINGDISVEAVLVEGKLFVISR